VGHIQKERQPLARKIVNSTDKIFRMVSGTNTSEKKFRLQAAPFLLKILIPALERQKILSRYVFNAISEIGVNYRNGPLTLRGYQGLLKGKAPRPGDRLPYFLFTFRGNTVNLQDLVNSAFFHLFLFSRNAFPDEFITYSAQFNGWLSTLFIPYDTGTMSLYKRLGIGKSGYLLVRPDMYIANRSKNLIIKNFEKYLDHLSIVTPAINRGNS
jgi:hypothetical protein